MGDIYFYGKEHPFSNFYEAQIECEGKIWSTSEHYFQAMKFSHLPDYFDLIVNADTPAKTAALARQKKLQYGDGWYVNKSKYGDLKINQDIQISKDRGYTLRSDWEEVKDNIMRKIVYCKFYSNLQLRQYIISTGDLMLYEDSPSDYYWGIGKERNGKNMLGIILMEVRYKLQSRINIIGSKYDDPKSDFEYLMKCPELCKALFIYNDNQNNSSHEGNKIMRKYNKFSGINPPRSASIPIGNNGENYLNVNDGKRDIDSSFDEIKELILTGNYDTIVYSIETYGNYIIRSALFDIPDDIREYITNKIIELRSGGYYYFYSSQQKLSNPIK